MTVGIDSVETGEGNDHPKWRESLRGALGILTINNWFPGLPSGEELSPEDQRAAEATQFEVLDILSPHHP